MWQSILLRLLLLLMLGATSRLQRGCGLKWSSLLLLLLLLQRLLLLLAIERRLLRQGLLVLLLGL